MLRRNSDCSQFITPKVNSVLKHKTRNLRAKLKTLLSLDTCGKLNKRQKIVRKMQQHEFYQFHLSKKGFTHCKQNPKRFFISEQNHKNCMHVFSKLSLQEIQQIEEDKIYYLGEQNIDKFDQFLMTKNHQISANQSEINPLKRIKTNMQQIRRSQKIDSFRTQSQFEVILSHRDIPGPFLKMRNSFQQTLSNFSNNLSSKNAVKRLKTANLVESRASSATKKSNQSYLYNPKFFSKPATPPQHLGNRQIFLQKRRIIQQQQNAQRIITKLTLQMKQQKAFGTLKNKKEGILNHLRERNKENQFKTKKILEKKRRKNVDFGAIIELNEQLRQVFIKKISPAQNQGDRIRNMPNGWTSK